MKRFLTFLVKKLWPDLETLAEPDRISLLGQLFGTFYNLPLVVVSLVWLVMVSDPDRVRSQWPVLSLMLGLGFILVRVSNRSLQFNSLLSVHTWRCPTRTTLLHGYTLGQVSGLVNIGPTPDGHVIGQQLQRDHRNDRRQ
jgi:hypothetical protein